jgi:hypothetical protein
MMYGTVSVQISLWVSLLFRASGKNNKKGRTNTALPFVFED